jgi:hypothetical protein
MTAVQVAIVVSVSLLLLTAMIAMMIRVNRTERHHMKRSHGTKNGPQRTPSLKRGDLRVYPTGGGPNSKSDVG